jgi:DNA-binding CsgD family transcriptional regulator/tetratricopeptide (TPR) repeat protein
MLLERSDQLAALSEALAEARDRSRGTLALVAGEAGVGKTSLVRELTHTETPQARVLWGTCDALFTPAPLAPLIDVAEQVGGPLAELVEREARPYNVVAELVQELRARAPTILVLEDVHWADEATLDVLRLLGRKLEGVPALAIATYRDDELDRTHPLRIVLGGLGSGPGVLRLQLRPLSPEAVARLAEPHRVDAVELYRRTAGNPFYVTEALAGSEGEIPPTVREAVLARAARLSREATAVLEAVAVVPPRAELWLLERLAGDTADHLEECLASGMLSAEGQAVGFRHELARLALEEHVPPARRRDLNRAAVAALADPPTGAPDLARLAHHAEAAGDGEAVLEYAAGAGERAASLAAHREAAAQFARALRHAGGAPTAHRAALLERRSYECYLTDQVEEAVEARRAALELWRSAGDIPREGDSHRWLSRLSWFLGRNAEAERHAAEAVRLLEPLAPGPELAMAYSNMAQLSMLAEETDAAVEWGTRAIELAESLGAREVLIHALNNVGTAEGKVDVEAGYEKLERSLELALEADLEEHVVRAYTNLSSTALAERRWEACESYAGHGIAYATERDLDSWRLYMLGTLAVAALEQGRWDEAAETAAEVVRSGRAAAIHRAPSLVVLGHVRARRGDPEIWPVLDEALALVEPIGELQRLAPLAVARAEAALLEGRPEVVADQTDAAYALALDRGSGYEIGELAWLRREAGIDDAVPEGIAEPYALMFAGAWEAAFEAWTALGSPYEAARALGRSDDEDHLRRALAELQGLGARPAAAQVSRRLRELGARGVQRGPRPSTRANPGGLTDRELEVLTLVSAGLKNAEIADRLFLSEKTVGHHVSAILRKLGARTRSEASAEAVRLGIPSQDR